METVISPKIAIKDSNVDLVYCYKVSEAVRLTNSIIKVVLSPTSNLLTYRIGQYCKILCSDGKYRPFSITSSPKQTDSLSFHIRLHSNHLEIHNLITVGSRIQIKGPYGSFSFQPELNTHTIYIAEGIGITSYYSLLNCGIKLNNSLLIWSRRVSDREFLDDLNPHWKKIIRFNEIDLSTTSNSEVVSACDNFLAVHHDHVSIFLSGTPKINDYVKQHLITKGSDKKIKFISDL